MKLKLSSSIFLFDVDYTLIDFDLGHRTGIGKIAEKLNLKVGEKFGEYFQTILLGHRVKHPNDWQNVPGGKEKYDQLITRITVLQRKMLDRKYGPKLWSREVLIYLASWEAGLKISKEKALDIRNDYWQAVKNKAKPYEHALEFLKYLNEREIPVFLHTSSDSILKVFNNEFIYDSQYSHDYKLKRIEFLRKKSFDFKGVVIGDPIEKPHPPFYHKALKIVEKELGRKIDPARIITVGDSYQSDVAAPLNSGFGTGILLKPGAIFGKRARNIYTVSALTEITELFS